MIFDWYEHAPGFPFDYRNDYYPRDFATGPVLLRLLRIPRTARGFRHQSLPRYQWREGAVNEQVLQAGGVLGPVLNGSCSAQTISNLTSELQCAVN